MPILVGRHVASHTPTSYLSVEPRSIGCAKCVVNELSVFVGYSVSEALLNSHVKVLGIAGHVSPRMLGSTSQSLSYNLSNVRDILESRVRPYFSVFYNCVGRAFRDVRGTHLFRVELSVYMVT